MLSAGLLASSGTYCTTFDTVVVIAIKDTVTLLHTFTDLSEHITYKAIYKISNSSICWPMYNPDDSTTIDDNSSRG